MNKLYTIKIFTLLVLSTTAAFAQQFQTIYDFNGDDYVNRILVNNGGLSLIGSTTATPSAGGYDACLMGMDFNGVTNGGGHVGGSGTEFGTSLSISPISGETTIVGRSNSFNTDDGNHHDILVVRLSYQGQPVWITVLGTDTVDFGLQVTEANDGNVIIVGQHNPSGVQSPNNKPNMIVMKLDATTGAVIWSKSVGIPYSQDVAYDVHAIGNQGYIVVGYTGVNVMGLNEGLAVILSETGALSASFIVGGPGDDDVRSFVNTTQQKFFLAGNTRNIGQGGGDCFLARFDVTNFPPTMDWFKTYGGTGDESFSSAIQTTGDGVLMVGSTQSFGTGGDAFAISVDFDGAILWSVNYGGTGSDIFQNIAADFSGGYVAAGFTSSFGANQSDVYIVRMDATGDALCNGSDADFVAETIASNVAYMSSTDLSLADITSTDLILTVRDASAMGFNQDVYSATTLCTTVGVEQNVASGVSVYPNPAGEVLNFNLGSKAADVKALMIYNAIGAKVYEASLIAGKSILTVDISSLANGLYTAVIVMNDSQIISKITVAK